LTFIDRNRCPERCAIAPTMAGQQVGYLPRRSALTHAAQVQRRAIACPSPAAVTKLLFTRTNLQSDEKLAAKEQVQAPPMLRKQPRLHVTLNGARPVTCPQRASVFRSMCGVPHRHAVDHSRTVAPQVSVQQELTAVEVRQSSQYKSRIAILLTARPGVQLPRPGERSTIAKDTPPPPLMSNHGKGTHR
jgi:hypothetical protein